MSELDVASRRRRIGPTPARTAAETPVLLDPAHGRVWGPEIAPDPIPTPTNSAGSAATAHSDDGEQGLRGHVHPTRAKGNNTMKTSVPMIAGAIAAMTLTVSGCSDDHETLTPTGPSAISEAAEGPATARTTGNPTAGLQINDGLLRTGDNWEDSGLNRTSSYTYIDGVPGNPRNVRVRPTGETIEFAQTHYELLMTWKPPNWGATDANLVYAEVRNGQTVIDSARVGTVTPPIESPLRGVFLQAAEGQFYMSLCNDVGCGPPWNAGSIVGDVPDAVELELR